MLERKEEILKLLQEKRTVKANELAEKFSVSMETIRRDLSELESMKLIRRIHGGAVLYTEYAIVPDYTFRTAENNEQKLLIAQKAVEMIKDGDSIIIDSGTTMWEVSKLLKGKKDLTVFTSSIKIAYELMNDTNITVMLLGGKVRSGEGITSGYLAEEMIDKFYVDKLLLGVDAITAEYGVMDYHIEETNLRRHYINHAKQVIALTDYSKFGIKALNQVCKIEELDFVVTDGKTNKKMIKDIRSAGVKVIIA